VSSGVTPPCDFGTPLESRMAHAVELRRTRFSDRNGVASPPAHVLPPIHGPDQFGVNAVPGWIRRRSRRKDAGQVFNEDHREVAASDGCAAFSDAFPRTLRQPIQSLLGVPASISGHLSGGRSSTRDLVQVERSALLAPNAATARRRAGVFPFASITRDRSTRAPRSP
jgi:hypothetical protein